MRSVAVVLDGVIRKPLDREAQDVSGALLFSSLTGAFRVVVLGTEDKARDEQFMLIHGHRNYVKIEPSHPEDVGAEIKGQLRRLRTEGFTFEFVVVPDPELAMELLEDGVTTLLYTHPRFSPPEAKELKPWDELADRIHFEVLARAEASQEKVS